MVFTSQIFLLFFLLFFLFYWLLKNTLKLQNFFLLAGSYLFYTFFDWRFLFLLLGSSILTYLLGIGMRNFSTYRIKALLLTLGLVQALSVLFFFKYFNFFATTFTSARPVNLILPLGISFYTFRMVSYLLDIDKQKIEPEKNLIIFLNYVAFFPSLIAGPIDRANLLLPQLNSKRIFDDAAARDGLRQILWGLFKKLVIADNAATLANSIFENQDTLPASTLLAGAFFYTIQIYADFSGYSDMAIGIARLLGFKITKNFDYPFFAQNIAEFWRKWHISLTSFATEYVFTPLSIALRDKERAGLILSIVINFTLIGIWHGANWTFILFGFLHGCYFIPLIVNGTLNKRKKITSDTKLPTTKEAMNMLLTFLIVMLTFILFRANSVTDATTFYKNLFSMSLFSFPDFKGQQNGALLLFFSLSMLVLEWIQRDKNHALEFSAIKSDTKSFSSTSLRWSLYLLLIFLVLCFEGREQDFIYLKF